MTDDPELRGDILELVDSGGLPAETIVTELSDEYLPHDIRVEIEDLADSGTLEELPDRDDVYRVSR